MGSSLFRVLWGFVIAMGVARSARAADDDPLGASSLLFDIERIVASQERVGWFVERLGQQKIEGDVQESLCLATDAARMAALTLARQRSQALGTSRAAFTAAGEQVTARLRHALRAERVVRALERGIQAARADCPFWAKPERGFLGLHSDRYRWTLTGESGGNVQLRRSEKQWTFGGGGAGRLLVGYGVSRLLTLLGGFEFGGGAMLKPGTGETRFTVNYFPAIPLIVRLHDLDWHYDMEFGPVGLFQSDNQHPSFGWRWGLGIGVSALRTAGLIPWAGLAGTYEYYLRGPSRPPAQFFRGGLRIGVTWAP